MVRLDIEVVDRKLDYNIILGCSWTYAMTTIVFMVFCIILFPLDRRMVDPLPFCTRDYSPLPSGTIPLVGGMPNSYVSIGTVILKGSSLMGLFPLPPPKVPQIVSMVSTLPHDPIDP